MLLYCFVDGVLVMVVLVVVHRGVTMSITNRGLQCACIMVALATSTTTQGFLSPSSFTHRLQPSIATKVRTTMAVVPSSMVT